MVVCIFLTITLSGAVTGYLLGTLTWEGVVSPPFVAVHVLTFGVVLPWVGMILLMHSTFAGEFPMNKLKSIWRVFMVAPLWSKLLPLVLALCTFGGTVWLTKGNSIHFNAESWPLAEPWQRGLLLIRLALFWVVPVPFLLAVKQRKGNTDVMQLPKPRE
jgi:hypothetical protein